MPNTNQLSASELIINPDGSIYHLGLKPSDICADIITVGDPDRIDSIIAHMEEIIFDQRVREFRTVKALRNGKEWLVISTGIGTDNVDIVLTELDALVNIDFSSRTVKPDHTSLRLYRLGTSGALTSGIEVDSLLVSIGALGLDGLMPYYADAEPFYDNEIAREADVVLSYCGIRVYPYLVEPDQELFKRGKHLGHQGITITAAGFYGPQGRTLRKESTDSTFLQQLTEIEDLPHPITNLEMETAGIYAMSKMLGHQAISINAILANRINGTFSKIPRASVGHMIQKFFECFG